MSAGWCDECADTGTVDCRCAGDICLCDNAGEIPCPACRGDSGGAIDGLYDDDALLDAVAGAVGRS